MAKIVLVIPAYNEEKRIKKTLKQYISFFEKRYEYQIIVASNKSTDKTLEVVKSLSRRNKKIKILDLPEKGKGYAVREGFKDALKNNYDLIGFVDADMSTPPSAFNLLIEEIKDSDCTIADRSLKDSKIFSNSVLRRKILNRCFNFAVRFLFILKLGDTQCGAKLFRRKVLSKIINKLRVSGWVFDVEILYLLKKNNFKVKSVKTTWYEKSGSKINLARDLFKMLSDLIKLRIRFWLE